MKWYKISVMFVHLLFGQTLISLNQVFSKLAEMLFDSYEKCESIMYNDQCWVGRLPTSQKHEKHCNFLRHYRYDNCQSFHDGSTQWTLPINTTFSDLDYISRSQQCQTVLTENFKLLSKSWNFVCLLITSSRPRIYNSFIFAYVQGR